MIAEQDGFGERFSVQHVSQVKQHASHPLFVPEPTTQHAMDPTGIYPGLQGEDEMGADSCILSESVGHQEDREEARTPKVSSMVPADESVSVRDTLIPRVCYRFKCVQARHLIFLSKYCW